MVFCHVAWADWEIGLRWVLNAVTGAFRRERKKYSDIETQTQKEEGHMKTEIGVL